MYLIADSSTSRTSWALADNGQIVDKADTSGLNPYFQSRREMSHIIRLELPDHFFRAKLDHVFFYGSGCANIEKIKTVESSIVAQFRTPATINSDLLGAARGLLLRQPGLACIMSVGTNSCFYNGERIMHNVRPGGFLLGDEGSGAHLGRMLVADIIKELAPTEVTRQFYSRFKINLDQILDMVYTHPHVTTTLSMFSTFLHENLNVPYCYNLVKTGFESFFKRNILAYDYREYPIAMVGSVACDYQDVLKEVAAEFGATISQVVPSPLEGLVRYHTDNQGA
ncbi:MAG: hypothetical protein LIP03_08475 [Bacteroidales bacterium]|nr:hypothetical protein [Bacteroidales bacterium]